MVTTTNQRGAYRALLNNTDGIVRQVVELHQPTPDGWQECRGCPEGDNPDYWIVWPCRTTQLIAEQVGVSLNEDDHTIAAEPIERPTLRPGEGQYNCFLADQCTGDPRCRVTTPACQYAQSRRDGADTEADDRDETR